jgi:hypothetical protein
LAGNGSWNRSRHHHNYHDHHHIIIIIIIIIRWTASVRILGYRSGGPGSILGTIRFSVEGGGRKEDSSVSGTGSTRPRECNWGATW